MPGCESRCKTIATALRPNRHPGHVANDGNVPIAPSLRHSDAAHLLQQRLLRNCPKGIAATHVWRKTKGVDHTLLAVFTLLKIRTFELLVAYVWPH